MPDLFSRQKTVLAILPHKKEKYGIFKTNAGRKPVQLLFCSQRKPPYGRFGDAVKSDVFKSF